MPKHILITNDDGIESKFLHAIASALESRFRISVAAPKLEQSWIGRAVSRRGEVTVDRFSGLPWDAWSIGGTPTDCVNIALGNLLVLYMPGITIYGRVFPLADLGGMLLTGILTAILVVSVKQNTTRLYRREPN